MSRGGMHGRRQRSVKEQRLQIRKQHCHRVQELHFRPRLGLLLSTASTPTVSATPRHAIASLSGMRPAQLPFLSHAVSSLWTENSLPEYEEQAEHYRPLSST